MSIKNEIDRITTAKQDIKSAIEDKGVSVPDDAHIDEYSQYIEGLVNPSDVVTSLNGEMGDVTLRPTYYKLNGTPVTDRGGVGQKYPIAISNLTPSSPAPIVGDTVVFYTDSYTYIGTVTEKQTSAIIVEVKVTMLGSAGGGGSEYYDTVIGSQEDFEAWYDELDAGTYAGHSVLFLNGTYTRNDGKGLHLSDTLYTIKGVGNVEINITSFGYNSVNNKAGIWYMYAKTSKEYSIENIIVNVSGNGAYGFTNCNNLTNCISNCNGNIGVGTGYGFIICNNLTNCTGIGSGSGSSGCGFSDCNNLVNCIGRGNSTYSSGYGFSDCNNLVNCIGRGNSTYSSGTYGYGFYNCKICSNCNQDPSNPSTSATWGGINTDIDPFTCHEFGLLFESFSWDTINKISSSKKASSYFHVGDEKTIKLSTGEEITLIVLDFDHDDITGGGKAGITFGMKNLLATTYTMNSSDSNTGGWATSRMRTSTMQTILGQLPSDLQSAIKSVDKKTSYGAQSANMNTSSDKLFLLSQVELYGSNITTVAGEGTIYAYYRDIANTSQQRIKRLSNGKGSASGWWLRSPIANSSQHFARVISGGDAGEAPAQGTYGVSFCFCV